MGAMMIGAIPSFMPPLTQKQISEVYWRGHNELIQRTRPIAIIFDGHKIAPAREQLTLDGIILISPDQVETSTDSDQFHGFALVGHITQIAFLQHSSGTTQTKKGVGLSHQAVMSQINAYGTRLEISAADRVGSWLPLYHDMGLIACFLLPIVLGLPIVALDPFEWTARPFLLFETIETYGCSLVWMPNFAFHHLVRTRPAGLRYDLSGVRAWIDCSEPCRPETFDLFLKEFADCGVTPDRLQVCYAMAETVFAVSQTKLGAPVERLVVDKKVLQERNQAIPTTAQSSDGTTLELLSNGMPLDALQVAVVDQNRVAVPDGHIGEIAISGAFLFSGYWNLPKQTADRLVDGCYYTNDRGFKYQGHLYLLGRMDDLLILNGRNFSAHEIEAVVNDIGGVKPGRVFATSRYDPLSGTAVCTIYVEIDESERENVRDLQMKITRAIFASTQIVPREVQFIAPGTLLKSTSGKLNRAANRKKLLPTDRGTN